jgi:hypothetical protein
MFQAKVVEKIKTHFMFSKFFPPEKSCSLWDNVDRHGTARQATDDNIIRRMRFACCITKATETHSEYVILIAFTRQQLLRDNVPLLRYTYIACLGTKLGVMDVWITKGVKGLELCLYQKTLRWLNISTEYKIPTEPYYTIKYFCINEMLISNLVT